MNTNKRMEDADSKKIKLVLINGGECMNCGYSKNLAALAFHHRDPKDKLFEINSNSFVNRKWTDVWDESKKCDLLCHNCHMELHHPNKELSLLLEQYSNKFNRVNIMEL